jgi:hypothetical protein
MHRQRGRRISTTEDISPRMKEMNLRDVGGWTGWTGYVA